MGKLPPARPPEAFCYDVNGDGYAEPLDVLLIINFLNKQGWRQHVGDYDAIEFPPTCPQCRRIVRPDVVLFGELLPPAKVQQLFAQCRRGFDAVFSVGTSSVFPYIAEPVRQTRMRGRPTIEINPGESAISPWIDIRLTLRAAPALDAIWTRYCQRRGVNLP